ncbi:MAG TPA: FtsX-like permease family protein [Bryobacteraceae bacterium]|nr:FtsX-like permease family protein [Bryobacteraceae bacterium]
MWIRRFGGDKGIIGRKLHLNGVPHEVVGVMPPAFAWPDATFELWSPLFSPASQMRHGANYGFLCTGRLKSSSTPKQAQAELGAGDEWTVREHPTAYLAGDQKITAQILSLSASQTASIRPTLLMLTAAVSCLLAIGCLNLAVLMMVRANGRAKEILMRISLGASTARFSRQLMAEAIPLILLGTIPANANSGHPSSSRKHTASPSQGEDSARPFRRNDF